MDPTIKLADLITPAVILIGFILVLGLTAFVLFNGMNTAQASANDFNSKYVAVTNEKNDTIVLLNQVVASRDSLQTQATNLTAQVGTLGSQVNSLNTQVAGLNGQVVAANSQITSLTTENTNKSSTILSLQSDNNSITNLLNTKSNDYNILKALSLDVNTKAHNLYLAFKNCRGALYDTNAIIAALDLNTCGSISAADLNIFDNYFK
jgi:chromosome segregation ATPase